MHYLIAAGEIYVKLGFLNLFSRHGLAAAAGEIYIKLRFLNLFSMHDLAAGEIHIEL